MCPHLAASSGGNDSRDHVRLGGLGITNKYAHKLSTYPTIEMVYPAYGARFFPPPKSSNTGAKALMALGLNVMAIGLIGLSSSSGWHTRRCVDRD